MITKWMRTCQTCSKKNEYKPINEYKNDKWRDVKCKNCKSADLDYGSEESYDPVTGKLIDWELEEDDLSLFNN